VVLDRSVEESDLVAHQACEVSDFSFDAFNLIEAEPADYVVAICGSLASSSLV
jgi:hypothetical protein